MNQASNFARDVDFAFYFIFGISLFFLVAITAVMIYFIVRYHKSRNPKSTHIPGSFLLEFIWTAIPTVLVLLMFYYGYKGFAPMRDVPDNAMKVTATARMWSWTFEYENGKKSPKLVVPHNKAVRLDVVSEDVVHALYVPAFRIKEDAVPGRTNKMWFIPEKLGIFDLYCAEYCGLRHAYMLTTVDVIPEVKFLEWYSQDIGDSPVDQIAAGFTVLQTQGCGACHSSDGTRLVAGTFKDLYGAKTKVMVGSKSKTITVDEDYIRRSIFEPNVEVVEGFTPGLMPAYKDKITESEINSLVKYLKSISKHAE